MTPVVLLDTLVARQRRKTLSICTVTFARSEVLRFVWSREKTV